MKRIHLTEEWFQGAVSLEHREDGVKPWRIPYRDYELYPPQGIEGKAEICAGVRIRFSADASKMTLAFSPLREEARIDCVVDGRPFSSVRLEAGDREAAWRGLPPGGKCIELWLPQNIGMTVSALRVDDAADCAPLPDSRPRWIAYGSSITQCVAAESPAWTWPALASRVSDFNLTCLGFSGNCHLEPMVARLIRDLPADLITLCLGINVHGADTLSGRTFQPAVIGMLQTIREKHADTPLIVISPIFAVDRETKENKLGLTVGAIRSEAAAAVEMLRRRGDRNLYCRDGRDWFGPDDAELLSDGLHPGPDGYKLLGRRFAGRILAGVSVAGNKGVSE